MTCMRIRYLHSRCKPAATLGSCCHCIVNHGGLQLGFMPRRKHMFDSSITLKADRKICVCMQRVLWTGMRIQKLMPRL